MDNQEAQIPFTEMGMPTHQQLVIPILKAVKSLGGSAKTSEIVDTVLEILPNAEELQKFAYPSRPDSSVLVERISFGRSTAKRVNALEQPSKGVYLITDYGEELLELPSEVALQKVKRADSEYARTKRLQKASQEQNVHEDPHSAPLDEDDLAESNEDNYETSWKNQLLNRLHELSPEGFEKFIIYLLRRQGLRLQHTGGSGDEGVDAIGTAPISTVLSSRVAVQIKRYAPEGKPIGRETVALFQRDAQTQGAERAILVTLSRFTEPARRAATTAIPTVDLISGDRLAELIRDDGESGVSLRPTVDTDWFKKFE